MRALNEMGAMRVRVSETAVDVVFSAPSLPLEKREEDAEEEQRRRKQEDEDDLFRSAG